MDNAPSCHNVLPESSLTGEAMIFSIIGARDTGKSNYIGVLIHELMERTAPSFDGSFLGFDDSLQRYKKYFGDSLYAKNQKLEQTQSSYDNSSSSAYRPLIFTLSLVHRSLFGKKIDNFTFVFFDTAGEDLRDFETMNTVAKYICKSQGIIFLLDPLKIQNVPLLLDEDTVSRASSASWDMVTRSDEIMKYTSELIRNSKNLGSDKQIETPVAVVFSKFDVIDPIVPNGTSIKNTSLHCGERAFVRSDFQNINNEIQSLLHDWNDQSLIQLLDKQYKNYAFFTASAFGLNNNPDVSGKINRPKPHRIEDAFLWLLAENKVIPQTK